MRSRIEAAYAHPAVKPSPPMQRAGAAVASGCPLTHRWATRREDVLGKIVAVKRLGQPEEVALSVAWLAADEGGYCTGGNISVNGGPHMS